MSVERDARAAVLRALAADPHQYAVEGGRCALVHVHSPQPLVTQRHHRFPKFLQAAAYGVSEDEVVKDPRFDGSLVDLCGTHHDSVHLLIRKTIAQRPIHKAPMAVRALVNYAVTAFEQASR